MNPESRIKALEEKLLRSYEMHEHASRVIQDLGGLVSTQGKIIGEILGVLAEAVPESLLKHRQALTLIGESSPEIAADFARFLSRLHDEDNSG